MSFGVAPNATNTPFYHFPKEPTSMRKPLTKNPRVSFRTKATVEESGFIGVKGESFYELLGISEGGSFDEIKKAYKQLARKYHPDVSPSDRTEEYTRRFIEVQEAYETLSDPSLRAMYDRDLARGLHLAFSTRRKYDEQNSHSEVAKMKDKKSLLNPDAMNEGILPCIIFSSYLLELEERSRWKSRWQDQMAELKRRSMNKDSEKENLSWGARMRRQRAASSS